MKFNNDNIQEPDLYLGASLKKKEMNGLTIGIMTSQEYIKNAIQNLGKQLKKKGLKLLTRDGTPMAMGYQPEVDSSPELNQDGITIFQGLIGILQWAVDIGKVVILTEIYMLYGYQAFPGKGYLEKIYHVFSFLKKNHKLTLYFDPR